MSFMVRYKSQISWDPTRRTRRERSTQRRLFTTKTRRTQRSEAPTTKDAVSDFAKASSDESAYRRVGERQG